MGWARSRAALGGLVALVLLVRVPFLDRPLGADEGGFLLVASQWSPGSSLYGDYWVDRPPLLIDVFVVGDHLAGLLGEAVALHALAALFAAVSVLLAARLGRLAGGSSLAAASTAAVFLSTPLFGVLELNGELVAAPFLLGALVLALEAARSPVPRRRDLLLVGTGAAGAAAVLVKQNEVDVAVVLLVGAFTFLRPALPPWRTWLLAGTGAALTLAVVLAHAASRGTDPAGLWDAVVTFRLHAARVIGDLAPSSTEDRLRWVLLALLGSGAPLLVAPVVRRLRRAPRDAPDLRWVVVALLAWELTSVLAGGSYWLHYLICLVPGLVLCAALLTTPAPVPARVPAARVRRRPTAVVAALGVATASCLVTLVVFAIAPIETERTPEVVTFLRDHDRPGDTAVVAFGRPDYLAETGMRSPYSQLWSLPVRVRDPDLVSFSRVLASPRRPDWIITSGSGTLAGWGIDDDRAQPLFERHYRQVAHLGDRRVFLVRSRSFGPS